MPDPPPRVYARQLLPLGYGHPLWTPESNHRFLRYREDGLRIGDVGVIVPENGSFDVFFNICLPRDHPFHRVNGVPNNFTHIDLDELDVAIYPHAENAGSVISTSSVATLRTVEPSDGPGTGDSQNALTYEFSLSSNEGALLILPDGAESYTLLKRKLFRDVAIRNALEWYNFAEHRLGRLISNGSLYLITGCYKSHSWSVAAFHEASSQTGATEFPAQFKAAGPGRQRSNISTAYTWETTRAMHWRIGPQGDWSAFPNQSVFISGFKVAIRDKLLGRKRVEVEVDAPLVHTKDLKLHNSGKSISRAGAFWRRLVSKDNAGTQRSPVDQDEAGRLDSNSGAAADDFVDDHCPVMVTYIPETAKSIHPSDVLNQYMLSKEPSVDVAVTHDAQWSILFQKGIMTPEDLDDNHKLESIMSDRCRLVSQDGGVHFQALGDFSMRLTDLDESVREAWKDDRLDDAEELLSRQIIRSKCSDHRSFAYRAFIRARLRHLDASLRDAQTANDIQPSVAARVAEGFALFGLEKYALAVNAFNNALRECDTRDKILVSLIKCNVLFEVGYHAESMADLADLIEHCPANMKEACRIVQVKMYIQLATLATKKDNYNKALHLLSRAQSHGPCSMVPEAEIVSLICGWKFDNLQFSIHREKCEVLYTAGRMQEAVESLLELTHNLGEDVRMAKDNASWTTMYTERCIKSLEGLGDSALASQSYTEAIHYYSATLSLRPTIRDGILVKRSRAYVAAGIWNEALTDAEEAIFLNPHSPWGYERKSAALHAMGQQDEAIQAFNDMLSTLERSAYYSWPLHTGPAKQTMSSQRTDHRGTAIHHYSSQRNQDHRSSIELVMKAIRDVDSRRTTDILDTLRAERDAMVTARKTVPGTQSDHLQQRLPLGVADEGYGYTVPEEQTHDQVTASERYQLYNQLSEMVRQTQEDDKQAPETMKMVLRLAEQQLILRPQQDRQSDLPPLDLLDRLQRHNADQRELIEALSTYWKKDASGPGSKGKQRGSDDGREDLLYIFRNLREDFIDALGAEAQTIVSEVKALRNEHRRLQQEIGQLMTMKSKYGPGGEFDPEWKPPVARSSLPERVSPRATKSHSGRPAAPPLPTRTKSTGPGSAQFIRPGWHPVEPMIRQRPLTVSLHPETRSFGLLGPPTPLTTPFLDTNLYLEPDSSLTESAAKRGHPHPSITVVQPN